MPDPTPAQTHTPEPWYIVRVRSVIRPAGDTSPRPVVKLIEVSSDALDFADACVNACVGMTNPAKEIAALRASVKSLNDELLRVRTSQHGAAHAIDNIATECGLEDRSVITVQAYVRDLRAKAAKWDAQFKATNDVRDASADARDAERYRKIRKFIFEHLPPDGTIDFCDCTLMHHGDPMQFPIEADFDAAIDAIGGGE